MKETPSDGISISQEDVGIPPEVFNFLGLNAASLDTSISFLEITISHEFDSPDKETPWVKWLNNLIELMRKQKINHQIVCEVLEEENTKFIIIPLDTWTTDGIIPVHENLEKFRAFPYDPNGGIPSWSLNSVNWPKIIPEKVIPISDYCL